MILINTGGTMKQTLKKEVLQPLLVIHLGVITLITLVVSLVPSSATTSILLFAASLCTVGGTVALWKFVNEELHSIERFSEAIHDGTEWESDRTDELGMLETEMFSEVLKKSA